MASRKPDDRPVSRQAFERRFPDERACADHLITQRWPDSFRCPKCPSEKGWRLPHRLATFECAGCGVQTSVTAGTVMHRTPLPLRTWFDTWHYYRSTPDDALLATIPGDKIFEVQLADALNTRRGKDLVEDLLRYRMLPGEGELPVADAIENLRAIGALRPMGPEVIADAVDALEAVQAGRKVAAATRRLTGDAGCRSN